MTKKCLYCKEKPAEQLWLMYPICGACFIRKQKAKKMINPLDNYIPANNGAGVGGTR